MLNIKFNYRYRDYGNYKNNGVAIFTNPNGYSLEMVDAGIKTFLLEDKLFRASRWGLKDLHFDNYDDENDHPYHEFISVELTNEPATEEITAAQFCKKIRTAKNDWE